MSFFLNETGTVDGIQVVAPDIEFSPVCFIKLRGSVFVASAHISELQDPSTYFPVSLLPFAAELITVVFVQAYYYFHIDIIPS